MVLYNTEPCESGKWTEVGCALLATDHNIVFFHVECFMVTDIIIVKL